MNISSAQVTLNTHVCTVHSTERHFCDLCGAAFNPARNQQRMHDALRSTFPCAVCSKVTVEAGLVFALDLTAKNLGYKICQVYIHCCVLGNSESNAG